MTELITQIFEKVATTNKDAANIRSTHHDNICLQADEISKHLDGVIKVCEDIQKNLKTIKQ